MPKNKFPPLSEALERLDKNVQSTSARALGSIRVSWSDAVVMRDALRNVNALVEKERTRTGFEVSIDDAITRRIEADRKTVG